MTPVERAALLAHARTRGFSRRVEEAQRVLSEFCERVKRPYVAFSGGKDSTVALYMAREICPDIPAVWSDDEWHLPETLAYIERVSGVIRIAGRGKHADWFTAWEDGRPEDAEWVEAGPEGALITWAMEHGYDGAVIGLRAEENAHRRVHLRTYGSLVYVPRRKAWQVYPLAWWRTRDVWAYVLSRGLDYNRAYDRLSEIGVPLEKQRIGPLASERALGYGQLAVLKAGWPELYERFAARYPAARRFT